MPSFLEWCTGNPPPKLSDDVDYVPFYTDPKCIKIFKDHVTVFLNRRNTGMLLVPVQALQFGTIFF